MKVSEDGFKGKENGANDKRKACKPQSQVGVCMRRWPSRVTQSCISHTVRATLGGRLSPSQATRKRRATKITIVSLSPKRTSAPGGLTIRLSPLATIDDVVAVTTTDDVVAVAAEEAV